MLSQSLPYGAWASYILGSAAAQLFEKISTDREICEDTYFVRVWNPKTKELERTNQRERITPRILALRLRNTVAHDHLTIQPLSPGKKVY
jgi:hypothetical protein